MSTFKYKPAGDTLRAFMRDNRFFRGIRGPVGSGKSVACAVELFRRALGQEPAPDGRRKSRWAIIRNSYPQLRTTTIKTWLDWFPEDTWGKMLWHPPPYTHRFTRGDLDAEFIFLALDRPEDVKKLLSLELTGAWINEAREVPKSIVDAVTMRVGRFPSMKDGGPTWYGVIADTNSPDEDHWWPIMSGEAAPPEHLTRDELLTLVKPENWAFFNQPGGMVAIRDSSGEVTGYELNKDAENRKNLTPEYYPTIIQGKDAGWIKVYVLNQLGSLSDGKPVFPTFKPDLHVAKEPILPVAGVPITVGMDFGLTPAAVFCQNLRGRWVVLHELVAQDMGIVRFAELFRTEAAARFPGAKFNVWGDPAGDYRAQTDERTPFQILSSAGIKARPTHSNDVALRIEAVAGTLNRLVDGVPGFLIDPRCINLKRALGGGYQYRRLQVSGTERYDERPIKDKHSHVSDALQYAFLGGGEGRAILNPGMHQKAVKAPTRFNVWDRQRQPRRAGPL